MKRRESDLSSLIGANGSIYAVRRSAYVEISNDLISDLVEPLALVHRGWRVVYEPEAVSVEDAASTYSGEYRRKVRILTRSIKGLLHMRALLNPFRYGIFSFQLVLHKLLRYFVPYFLLTGLGSLAGLAALGQYRVTFAFAAIAMTVAILVGRSTRLRKSNPFVLACHFVYYYLMVNYALVPAWINIVRGTRVTVWVPEREGV
jgi:cellulose synthase/poly-beta-1,6-N-acetylglucosamine synthase-like glycosyltransferase